MNQNKKLQVIIGLLLTIIVSVVAVITPYMINLKDDQDEAFIPTDPGQSLAAELPSSSSSMPALIYKGGGPSGGTINFQANKQYYIKLIGDLENNLPSAFNKVSGPWRPTVGENTGWPGIALYELTSDQTLNLPQHSAAWECTSNCSAPIGLINGLTPNSPIVKNELNNVTGGSTVHYLIIDHADANGRVVQFAINDQILHNVPVPPQTNDISSGSFNIADNISGKLIYQGNDSSILWGYIEDTAPTPTTVTPTTVTPTTVTPTTVTPTTVTPTTATPTTVTPTGVTPTITPAQCQVIIKPQRPNTTPTNTPTQGPTPTPGKYSCGYTPCTDDNSCEGSLVCVGAKNGKSYCAKPENTQSCVNNPNSENCCGPFYACGHSPCTDNDSCVGINDNYSCVLASNGTKYCAENSKIDSCVDSPSDSNCCIPNNTPTPRNSTITPMATNNPTTTPSLPAAGNSAPTVITTGIGILIIAAALLLLF